MKCQVRQKESAVQSAANRFALERYQATLKIHC